MSTAAWRPLRHPLFRALWIAAVASNIGTWMQNVGAAWLMTSLGPSPMMVALVQTATSLPVLLIALPAGALADLVDRRRLLLFAEVWMLVAAAGLGVLTLAGVVTPWLLLALTFALGLGAAMNLPAWQAIISELVPRADLPAAVALSGVGINIARALGPALGGVVAAVSGPGLLFLLNGASFVGVIVVLYRWERSPSKTMAPTERMIGAMRAGLRYIRHAPTFHVVLLRTGLFIVCASALWALLPLLARQRLGLGAAGYGALLGALGTGAVMGADFLPGLRGRVSIDLLISGATILFALVTLALAYVANFGLLCVVMLAGGLAWISVMSSLNVAAQTAVPHWVQARALGVYWLVFWGGMASGSVVWGAVAGRLGIPVALVCAAGGLGLGLLAGTGRRLAAGENLDLTPSLHWAEPQVVIEPHPEDGPVLVTVEYRIDPEKSIDFAEAMRPVSRMRRRDGAIRWGLFLDTADPGRYLETFVVESWAEHLRQHERVTVADREAESRARAFHIGDAPPVVFHLLTVDARHDRARPFADRHRRAQGS